jgi:hypothetical protein
MAGMVVKSKNKKVFVASQLIAKKKVDSVNYQPFLLIINITIENHLMAL